MVAAIFLFASMAPRPGGAMTVKNSNCSATSGSYGATGSPADNDGRYCWCKVLKLRDGSDVLNFREAFLSASWEYFFDYGSAALCADACLNGCRLYSEF
jgi:hypothetical protein